MVASPPRRWHGVTELRKTTAEMLDDAAGSTLASPLAVGEPDGAGLFGVLDESDEGLLCHECGSRFVHLGLHAWRGHGLTAAAYRRRHGLSRRRGLVATSTLTVMAEKARQRLAGNQRFLDARSPLVAAAVPRVVSPQGRERIIAANRATRGPRRRLGTVVICEQCGAAFCPLSSARKRRFCSRSCASTHTRSRRPGPPAGLER